ncbi:hypothetical protein CPB83DRAFT_506716 [Crepidotus variabilis]|uniref:Rap-GAP domain-containing protein n=1 Tax=Crepidotus variabilis TaxID=179855 RepID=A0A9P6JMR1_9AGAR|nr:hypothetical protein CPB83DRAFT_506716 [Crepidotus variabilis]
MSRLDTESLNKSRQRANTAFTSLWTRRPTQTSSNILQHQTSPQASLSVEALIDALQPSAVPSLSHARSLANALSTCSPLPPHEVLNPILTSLCGETSPTPLQAAGYDILSAYWENPEAIPLGTAERFSYFSLFLGGTSAWGMDLWEPRLKALRAVTKEGTDIAGIETNVIETLQRWIEGAFEGLQNPSDSTGRNEAAERERSLEILVKFLENVLSRSETMSRLSDKKMALILHFYAKLIDRSISLPESPREAPESPPTSGSSNFATTKALSHSHRRHISSLSSSSLPSSSSSLTTTSPSKIASECAVAFFLQHVNNHLKLLSHTHLNFILPVLFRSLASCSASLPRLSVVMQSPRKNTLEEKITDMLNSFFAGPYAANCMLILRRYLFPEVHEICISQEVPQPPLNNGMDHIAIMTSLGAHRTLRNHVRRALYARIARTYISRESSLGYSPSGAPGNIDLQKEWMEKAWPKEDYAPSSIGAGGNGWDAARLGKALAESVGAWVNYGVVDDSNLKSDEERPSGGNRDNQGKEEILEEAAGILKDILQELDTRMDEKSDLDEDEARVIGTTLTKLSQYILPLRESDGSPFLIPIDQPNDAPTPILRSISSLLAQDHTRAFEPLLSSTLIRVAEHLTDNYTSRLPIIMMGQHDLSPTSPDWLVNWEGLLLNEVLIGPGRPLTRKAIIEELQNIYTGVKDMTTYRKPFANLVWKALESWKYGPGEGDQTDDADVVWKILGEEIVLRNVEQDEDDETGNANVSSFLDFLFVTAKDTPEDEEDENMEPALTTAYDLQSSGASTVPSTLISPLLTRTHTESTPTSPQKERDLSRPSVMSMLSSLAVGTRSQSQPEAVEDPKEPPEVQTQEETTSSIPREVSAVSALVEVFSQLTFTPYSLEPKNLKLALRVYDMLLEIICSSKSTRARLAALQFLMRLRADRDHHLYFVDEESNPEGRTEYLAGLIRRLVKGSEQQHSSEGMSGSRTPDDPESRKARPRVPYDSDGKQLLRGRGSGPSHSAVSRSRSRTMAPQIPLNKTREPLWRLPEQLPFFVSGSDSPSEVLISYDPEGPDRVPVLPVSRYLQIINSILEVETNWEILSYVLCHLPTQLSNKHLFCGPKSRSAISKLLSVICNGMLKENFASNVAQWPQGLKARDAQGLAYQTLSVLISYKRCFESHPRHVLVEVIQTGLNGQLSTIKCCLHALSLSAFELQQSITRCLSRILEKLTQIMSNPNMAVHILDFLSIVGSLPTLYVNFTEADFKMVFGVALQYLQHYNQQAASPTMSWALSQHVRIMSYAVLYTWFIALKMPDRPRHIRFIARQLLLANEGNQIVDDATEVCFDWLARYTYASADPRPATSTLSDIILDTSETSSESQKSWIMGNAVITTRALPRSGWVEVMSRRPSGFSRFVCHVENVPMVGPGEVSPDLLSVPAALLLEQDVSKLLVVSDEENEQGSSFVKHPSHDLTEGPNQDEETITAPDPITGYVWSGTAPSQRRKQVAIDPSFLILQLSPFPDGVSTPYLRRVPSTSFPALNRSINTLDRIPVIDTHKVGILYVAPGQTGEVEILRNEHGSPAYTRFLEGIGRLINLRGQMDVYAGGLDPDEDGEYAYAWWDDIRQILYHTATMMPNKAHDPQCNNKKRHIGNDYVRIVWNDSGQRYSFDTLKTQFQFVNIVIEPHSVGTIAAFSNNLHEHEYFKVTIQSAPGMTEFTPVAHSKLISADNLPLLVRQLSLLSDWYAWVFAETQHDTSRLELKTNWRVRLESIRRIKNQLPPEEPLTPSGEDAVMEQEALRDFTTSF